MLNSMLRPPAGACVAGQVTKREQGLHRGNTSARNQDPQAAHTRPASPIRRERVVPVHGSEVMCSSPGAMVATASRVSIRRTEHTLCGKVRTRDNALQSTD